MALVHIVIFALILGVLYITDIPDDEPKKKKKTTWIKKKKKDKKK
tara:strand:- start:805 stop:939 length:135 start_codon:yes stop_codon:yes gene_type:complete